MATTAHERTREAIIQAVQEHEETQKLGGLTHMCDRQLYPHCLGKTRRA